MLLTWTSWNEFNGDLLLGAHQINHWHCEAKLKLNQHHTSYLNSIRANNNMKQFREHYINIFMVSKVKVEWTENKKLWIIYRCLNGSK